MSYYDGDPWSNHQLNEIKCAECGKEYDEQEGESNICPACIAKEGDKELLIEALEIAISHFDYDQEWFKADELRDYRDQLKKEGEGNICPSCIEKEEK